jgi:hypothetical protein
MESIVNKGTNFRQRLTTCPIRRIVLLCSLSFCGLLMACEPRYTEESSSPVVKLRNDLKALAIGDLDEVKGETSPQESYVLLYGYQGPIEDLPVSEELQQKLKSLTPYDYERFVLVHIVNDEVKEYTRWAAGDDPQFTRVPFLIRGQPFRITVEKREPYAVANKLEN